MEALSPEVNTTPLVEALLEASTLDEDTIFLRSIYEWIIPIMIIILLLAVLGNGVICVSSPFLSFPVSPYLRLCLSLSAADMWAATLMICGLLVNSYLPVVMGIGTLMNLSCLNALLEVFRVSAMLTSDWHLFALAVNHFLGTMWPLKYRMLVTTRRLRILILALWIIPLTVICAWFLWWSDDGLRHPDCPYGFYQRLPFRLFVFLLFTLPLLATLVLYTLIVAHLLKAKAEFKAKSCKASSNSLVHRGGSQGKSMVASKLKLVWTTLLIVSTFSLSWGVCVLYFTLVCVEGCVLTYQVSISFYTSLAINSAVNALVMVKLAANPFIYTLRIKKFRRSVSCLFRRIRGLEPRGTYSSKRDNTSLLLKQSSKVSDGNTLE